LGDDDACAPSQDCSLRESCARCIEQGARNDIERGEKRVSGAAGVMGRHPLVSYFVIAFAISWLTEATFVLSQDGSGLLPFKAPMSFMATVGIATSAGPAISAFVVTAIVEGRQGVADLFRRIVHWRVGLRWYLSLVFRSS
jgi:hypothetical protein